MRSQVLSWSRVTKWLLVMLLDVVMAVTAMWMAFSLRLDTLHWPSDMQWVAYALAPVLAVPVFIKFGLYRAIFRYTGLAALVATAQAAAVYGVLLFALLLWQQWPGIPRTIGLLQPLIFLVLVGISRALARFWLSDPGRMARQIEGRLLIYGAGNAGVQTATAIGITGQYKLIGFIDDDASKMRRSINGAPVFGPADISQIVTRHQVTDILLALPRASRERRNSIIESLRGLPVHIRTLPAWADLASGRVTVRDFRELDVEDLLGRTPVPPDTDRLARDLTGKVVLVTGAGGSIGSELCRQIVLQRPRQLLLLDHSEFGLYAIHQELQALCSAREFSEQSPVELVPLLGSVLNFARMSALCSLYRPAIVYHAAAYKHVPMVESNAGEGIANNVFGTLNMARAALENTVARFVLISTDKAVRPTNVMGASKRMAELVLQALAEEGAPVFLDGSPGSGSSQGNQTCFTMVRFGNVLGSSGSVVPLFRRQLADGGPLTVTHAEVTRYFMTIPEAAQLVLQAGAMAVGGDVFVLDMGTPVKILDLARRMVELSGLTVREDGATTGDIEIRITGLRPGEKLYEELLIGDNPEPTAHPRIMKAHEPCLSWADLTPELRALWLAAQVNDVDAIKGTLKRLVQGYLPS
ncbi:MULTISPECIES: nucleoside-diphosphate sugar epimerase/dehydratase [unclassified Polaromonas]|uniref:polysaccharide biosynthesis protein n=1 Tax=unclassified Polaromonas TaxID=2638319 RepID=UPI000BC76811|nr:MULTISPECIES: nucleoside-diphosphate sugar epimerase/dehydratase [unclassified Polaromonas]OYY36688.1 MAG: polysaccharide biosynthesis protein [Polaromonas sp. 35-63-35]OYZ22844.1 MAG: polysaccharide biosynthesis protein [Polaromonas sp. 16-63-31]OYZ81469.1 MAG: polysaccharide biosynthesis protein [Polaromonas sp. 24-63-21]OZA53059.1 MAG: polysaccharide biosynthesis protein [Polaromonas sp. 17-63-33]OZA88830.1 MAG: polysaccharide biosynthesis protein [Polaromonas sp. 39-63-25]